ncbi:Hint domain-containing protein [Marimonas lutisalis]|uniref:Hint domain-containing protein n=1 Tax=Marimonas lutisalis TaxID=2545756 RepID=UPI001375DD41|nr:Hint domain-containing protein [Marimonas lutisalis]
MTNSFRAPDALLQDGVLPRGTLLVETRLSADGAPQTLLGYERLHPRPFKLSIQAIPGGGVVVVMADGDEVFHAALNQDAQERADVLRVSLSWDVTKGWGRLAIERPEQDKTVSTELTAPHGMRLDDIREMTTDPRRRLMDADVQFFAVSSKVEPIGPMPTLTGRVPLLGAGQYIFAGKLRRGDLVETMESGLVPVLHAVQRLVPARGSFRPVRLRAPYFGLQSDIVVAPDQRLVVGGSEVEYMFGREAVLVPARHLVNGISAIAVSGPPVVRYTQVILPAHESVIAAGCPVESLYLGRIRRKADRLSESLLAGIDRRLLPEHAKSAYPMLKPFEALTLVQRRAA